MSPTFVLGRSVLTLTEKKNCEIRPEFQLGGLWIRKLSQTLTHRPLMSPSQLYAKLQAYAGQRQNNTAQKQLAWDQINAYTAGAFSDPVKVGGVDVIEPINQVSTRQSKSVLAEC